MINSNGMGSEIKLQRLKKEKKQICQIRKGIQ